MLDLVTRLIQPIVQIKRDEWRKAIPMFLYFSFTIASIYILKPIQKSLFLSTEGAARLPYAYIGEAIFLVAFTSAYILMARIFTRRKTLFYVATLFFVTNLAGFWVCFHHYPNMKGLSYFFYVWVSAYTSTIVTQFWTLANDLFNPREAKRLFGFILSGGSLGGVLGGLFTHQTAESVGTENLLLLVGGLLLGCLFLIHWAVKEEWQGQKVKHSKEPDPMAKMAHKSTWKFFFSSRYLLLLAALVMIAKMSSTVIDNQFNAIVEETILEKHARTAFFGGFFATLNIVSFILQLVVASFLLRHLGLGITLLLLPIGLACGSLVLLFMPILAVAMNVRIFDGGMNYSVGNVTKELLYIPIPSSLRYRVKPVIDNLGFRYSKAIAGGLILLITTFMGIPSKQLGIAILILAPLWVIVAWGVRDEYLQAIRNLISGAEPNAQPSTVTRKVTATGCYLASHGLSEQQVTQVINMLTDYEAFGLKRFDLKQWELDGFRMMREGILKDRLIASLPKIKDHNIGFEAFLLQQSGQVLPVLSEVLVDSKEDVWNKRLAILMLSTLGSQSAVDVLLGALPLTHNASVRFNIIHALNLLETKGAKYMVAPWVVKKEILREVEDYRMFRSITNFLASTKGKNHQYLLSAWESMGQEAMERIFRLLSLLYSNDIILVVYKRLYDSASGGAFKAHAVELLENLIEPALARAIVPLLDELEHEDGEEAVQMALATLLDREDPWIMIFSMLLVVEFKYKTLYPRVDLLAKTSFPMVREIQSALR